MIRTPLFSGILYIVLGLLFTYFAVQDVQRNGEWGIFTYLFVILATFDFGSGIRMVLFHFKVKAIQKDKK
ncbi:hypothetical protein J27TS8_40040 [Robertmurraya siralis]|jgi:uncharacterized membrane protein HdeD (DUF308 family)|uniref:DUF4305 domain-containing protein n=1 Tax=Robertmurraya siralis TaxID=77777 RepID=A0A920BVZ9_9BACI|nr:MULTISPECIES: YdiK family protein [Robertmurraya]MDF1509996.1 YdiK family protein [Robertmurraya sp. DFI.2.37]PAE19361.1 hypothetical protein CHH80_17355 [Bacillus sp. 7504-2]GIN64011.1 hypothetical protein J27TS8_40040 [Robertmurraya siralis]